MGFGSKQFAWFESDLVRRDFCVVLWKFGMVCQGSLLEVALFQANFPVAEKPQALDMNGRASPCTLKKRTCDLLKCVPKKRRTSTTGQALFVWT